MAIRRTSDQREPNTKGRSRLQEELICKFWASVARGTSASRTRLLAQLAHSYQDARCSDARRQRPLLRLARRGADALHPAGDRHDPPGPAPGCPRVRRKQDGGCQPRGRRSSFRPLARVCDPASSQCDRGRRRSSSVPARTRRLLPARVGRQQVSRAVMRRFRTHPGRVRSSRARSRSI